MRLLESDYFTLRHRAMLSGLFCIGALALASLGAVYYLDIFADSAGRVHTKTIELDEALAVAGLTTLSLFLFGLHQYKTSRREAKARAAAERHARDLAYQAGMAEIATGVLHNVGNVLNSLGIAASTARRELKALRLERLEQATALLLSHRASIATFLTEHERGRHLPDYLPALTAQLVLNVGSIQAELETMDRLLQHLSGIVSAQGKFARGGGRYESVRMNELVETALLMQAAELAQIEIARHYEDLSPVRTDPHKVLQIIVNLLANARDALKAGTARKAVILVKLAMVEDRVCVTIEDSGIGMSEEVLGQLWQFGFTTKKDGHGFGLHNSANAAREIGATLTAHSDGLGQGSRFTLSLPMNNTQPMTSEFRA